MPAPTPIPPSRRPVRMRAGLGIAAALITVATPACASATTPQSSTAKSSTSAAGTSASPSDTSDRSTKGIKLTLPAPTGRLPIGTVALHLIDRSRPDPLKKSKLYRELMVSVWYPATKSASLPLAPYMSPGAAADWDKTSAPPLGIPSGTVDWAGTLTHAKVGAPVNRAAGKLPVVVFASGDGGERTLGTALVEELASRGYIVVSVDHTYEADQVEFPGGRVERAVPLPVDVKDLTEKIIADLTTTHIEARLADMKFVLKQLTSLNGGHNPDADGAPLPTGLIGALDLSRIGMLGQSLGGSVAAQLAHDDRRVDAGVDLDGEFFGPVRQTGVAKPFLILSRESHDEPSLQSFWNKSTGWKRELRFAGAQHGSFGDLQTIFPQVAAKLKKVPDVFTELVGTIDPDRSIAAQRAYVTAFFDLHLKGQRTSLFDGATTTYPEVKLIS